jgi:hypothetical protein
MAWYHEIASAAAALFRRRHQDAEMKEEIQFHLEMEARRNAEAGMTDNEAKRRAQRDFGGLERHKDDVRDERRTNWFFDGMSDLRFALRSLRQRPGLTAAATLTLALGVGATSAVFGVVKHVLLTPLPYGQPERVVAVWSAWKGFEQTWLSYDEWEGWKARVTAFSDIGLYSETSATIDGDSPERVRGANIHANVLSGPRRQPDAGPQFLADEDRVGGPRVAILSHELWERRYGGDPSVVGKSIQVSGNATTVIGVMPPSFRLPLDYAAGDRTDIYFPLATDAANNGALPGPAFPKGGSNHGYNAVARLAPGATAATANAQLRTLVAELEQFGYMANVGFHAFVVPIEEQITGRVRPVLLVVFGAVVLVLLIACANVAGLLLVRGEARRRELAVACALGAGTKATCEIAHHGERGARDLRRSGGDRARRRHRAGAAIERTARPAASHRNVNRLERPRLRARHCRASPALLTGVLPLAHATHLAPAGELREGGRGATSGRARLRWRQALVATEIALAVVLVAGAGLMIRTVRNLLTIDPGFRADGVLTMRISTPSLWYPDAPRVVAFWDDVQRRVSALPGVKHVAAVRLLPLATEMGDWGLTSKATRRRRIRAHLATGRS